MRVAALVRPLAVPLALLVAFSFDLDAFGSERLRLQGEPCARPRPALPRAA